MYTVMFYYSDKSFQEYNHITRIEYYDVVDHVVTGDEISTHQFPIQYDKHLFSEKTNYTVSATNVKSIAITKED